MDYPPRIYYLSLHVVGLTIGAVVFLAHLYALLRPADSQKLLLKLPRSKTAGIILLAIDAVWCFWLISTMDLEEFAWLRPYVQFAIPVLFFLTIIFVDELLAARALGIFAMLIAEPMISSAFLRPELWRLLIVLMAYVWLTLGMFWVGKPYLLRDQITWVTKSVLRWRIATVLGVVWGALILGFALKG
ncbi:MAG: hypothetical protein JOZ08_19485 [Verrucomicrobia bacterium]|nr:hypothetical protein [Verrucomicrobiota bacterium]MBV8277639.1 hypothetical protein [Verrucomicrobiota bacterium]